ncbi:MAG: hypothetical protein MH472_05310 [Bacteroidia bacterium]|nr:hypothetical protein [Bacteroidia bacterium]
MGSSNFFIHRFGLSLKMLFTGFVFVAAIAACKDPVEVLPTPETPGERWDTVTNFSGLIVPETGKLNFSFSYVHDGKPVVFNTQNYTNAAGDTFNIREIRHYFSNVTLENHKGEKINLGTYHLLDANISSTTSFTIDNVPPGNYKNMTVLLGVDSVRNHSGLQEGALDPAFSMFWTWSTGYIFFRINGLINNGESYSFDIGGDKHAPYQTISLNSFKVKSKTPTFNMVMDVNELYQNPEVFSFKNDGTVIHSDTDPGVDKMGKNMKDLLSIKELN